MNKPHCIGFIMDGNRRWANAQNLPTFEGHRQGLSVLLDSVRFVREQKIPHAVYYAFSTENWKRSETEVTYLMELFKEAMGTLEIERQKEGVEPVHIRFIGRWEDLPTLLQLEMGRLEDRNQDYEATTTIWIALSYGGRAEILEAVNKAVGYGRAVTEDSFKKLLWTANLPDPDIIVRTSGEYRLSNFLTWSSVYSELHFIEKSWPALTADDFEDILNEYEKRERREGK